MVLSLLLSQDRHGLLAALHLCLGLILTLMSIPMPTFAYLCLLMPVSCRVVAGTAALPLALLAVAVCCSWLHVLLFCGVCLLLVAVLNKKSGLLGVSGHNDLRTIIELKVRNCQLLLRNVLLRVRPNQSNLIRS